MFNHFDKTWAMFMVESVMAHRIASHRVVAQGTRIK
jgi:hypothetical protein